MSATTPTGGQRGWPSGAQRQAANPLVVKPTDAKTLIRRYENSPVLFATEVLGHDVWHTPAAVLKALTNPQAQVAVKSCHASGKTFTAAEAVLWWVCTGGVAITTAPSANQVERVLWGEIRTMHARARLPIDGRILIVLDEAVGIRPDIWEAIDGIQAGGDVRLLALGNPTVPAGPFYDAFGPRSAWARFTIDGFDTPNLRGYDETTILTASEEELNHNARPYLMTRRWMRDKLLKWGSRSPLWLARGRGQFAIARCSRHRNDWLVCCNLLRLGYSPGQCVSVLTHPHWFTGSKYREAGHISYVYRTIAQAQRVTRRAPG